MKRIGEFLLRNDKWLNRLVIVCGVLFWVAVFVGRAVR